MIEIANGVDGAWGWAMGLAQALVGLACLVFFVRRGLAYGAERDRAIAIESSTPKLRPGPIVVRGTVQTEDRRPAVEIVIEQTGREFKTKNGHRHEWHEVGRTTTVRPFTLLLDDDSTVEVRPPDDVVLIDELETTSVRGFTRTRTAVLSHGESASVSGVLSVVRTAGGTDGGYRGGSQMGYRLTPARGAVLSATHLAEAGWRWSRFHGWWAILTFLTLAIGQTVLWIQFYDVGWFGERRTAEVVALEERRAGRNVHLVVRGRIDDEMGEEVEADVTPQTFFRLEVGDRIPWRVVPGRHAHHQIGPHLQVSWVLLAALVMVNALLALLHHLHRKSTTRWWEMENIVEQGSGRLPDA